MMIRTYFLIYFLVVFQFNSNIVLSQRNFPNPAITDPAPCACDVRVDICDPNCCCDSDCDNSDLSVSPICQSIRTVSSYSSSEEVDLQTWNCSNSTSAALYDYFPFVCVQLGLNEIIGEFYSTDNVTFVNASTDVTNLVSSFVTQYPDLFQPTTLSPSTSGVNYSIGAPVQVSSGTLFTLPGNLVGSVCQENVNVLFGVNRDVSCISSSLSQNLCTSINNTTSFLKGGTLSSSVPTMFFTKTYTQPTITPRDFVTEYYFQDQYPFSISNISYNNGSINDYCPGRYPLTRTQRYGTFCTSSNTSLCNNNQYQIWNGCPLRYNLNYNTIPDSFFSARATSIDGPTNFADFANSTNVTSISCSSTSDIRRVFYRFNYSSIDNTISTVEVFVLLQTSSSPNLRITIEWNDISSNLASSTTIPRGYLAGEVLQFRHNSSNNNNISDVSSLVPTYNGLCVDATRQILRYKESTSSYCFIQLKQATIHQCHDLKLNMYLYLNVFYAPASAVLAYPNANATEIPIRDNNQDLIDLDQIDETRPDNQLNVSYILQTSFNPPIYAIYDTTQTLPVCYNVPSGIYIEFGFVRVSISPTISFERIVSVQYNYTYSNWQFDCNQDSCDSDSTQQYLVSFQAAFVDYTISAFHLSDTTSSDLNSADDYIQQLLWLITSEYNGEPGYRNYTIAMILIFIAISVVVMHILLFGIMCPL